ncbi:MAG: hypothetical protein LBQ68_04855, partial [Clostridiales bacterium]|nr:hypothetical protein [Clostridiales bacterium]
MKIIVPCAGRSSRFPNMRPKWMLNAPNGDLMIKESLKGITHNPQDLIITILREHELRYHITKGIEKCFGFVPSICMLDEQTKSQSETVYKTIEQMEVSEPFLVKDSD